MTVALIYHKITKETGEALATELGIVHGNELRNRPTQVIRWGNADGLGYIPQLTLNKQVPMQRAINKNQATTLFHSNGIKCPARREIVPCVGRSSLHTQGQNFWLCWEQSQIASAREEGAEYFIEYIPIKQEYRVHVLGGRAIFVQRKYAQTRVSTAFMGIQGFRNEWHKRRLPLSDAPRNVVTQAVNAVACLGLDFGGVDVVVSIDNNLPYVLEVNTGPSLPTPETREPYLEYFRERLDI